MYQRIMVPLDGSELAECVLPHVEAIATGCGVREVMFVRVFEPYNLQRAGYLSEEDIKRFDSMHKKETESYIDEVVNRVKYDGVNVKGEVLTGRAEESLAEYADKNDVQLVVIATHGRSGVSRWVWGSVADRLLRSVCVPVLMVRAPGCVPGI